MAVLPTILQPGVLNETISQVRVINDRLQNFFGANTRGFPGRYFGWDIFNDTRQLAKARAPGTGPARSRAIPVGHVNGNFPRFHDSVPLLLEEINNFRQIGGNAAVVDTMGEKYISEQMVKLKQKFTNVREFMFAGMIRGSFTYTQTGDDLDLSFSGGATTINFQVPAGNLTKLNMLGSGDILAATWDNTGTDIPGHLYAIDAAFENLIGRNLRHVWCTSTVWGYVLNNLKVQGQGGTANVVFETLSKSDGTDDFTARLRALPWLTWHITNGGLDVGNEATPPTFTKLLEDDHALFCPEPSSDWIQIYEGSEPVVEYPGAEPALRTGQYFWAEPTTKPAGYELIGLDNAIPALKIPKAIAYGLVKY